MSEWLYTVRERFTRDCGDRFLDYCDFSGFADIGELVTLDSMMCPDLVAELVDEDWKHNVHEDFRVTLFYDADYLMKRQSMDESLHQVLAVFENPSRTQSPPDGFELCGYDIMDCYVGNSTLTNCGPLPSLFSPSEVNACGLLDARERAYELRDAMRREMPEDPHLSDCEVWLIARRLVDCG